MKRTAYGRDTGLSTRLALTMFTLGLIYVAFFVVMVQVLNVGIFAVVLIIGVLAFVQYYTSDKIALLASGAKIVQPDEAPELHAMIERRQLPGVIRVRRRVLLRADDLLDWLDQKRAPSPEE